MIKRSIGLLKQLLKLVALTFLCLLLLCLYLFSYLNQALLEFRILTDWARLYIFKHNLRAIEVASWQNFSPVDAFVSLLIRQPYFASESLFGLRIFSFRFGILLIRLSILRDALFLLRFLKDCNYLRLNNLIFLSLFILLWQLWTPKWYHNLVSIAIL